MKGLGILVVTITLAIGAWWMMKAADSSSATGGAPSAKAAQDAARRVEAQQRADSVSRQLIVYKNEKGSFPKDLEELQAAGFIERVPQDVNYDPATGACTPRL